MVWRPFSFCSSKRQLLNYGGWLIFESLTVPNSSKKRGTHWNKTTVVGWLIPSWWCFKYPVVSSRKSKGYTLHNHPKDQFPNHLFGWLDFQGKHHCHLPEMNWCFTVQQTKPSLSCHYNFITQKNQQPKHKNCHPNNFFWWQIYAQNPNGPNPKICVIQPPKKSTNSGFIWLSPATIQNQYLSWCFFQICGLTRSSEVTTRSGVGWLVVWLVRFEVEILLHGILVFYW